MLFCLKTHILRYDTQKKDFARSKRRAGDPSHNLLYCCQHHARFQVYAEKYAEDEDAFFKDYAEAHAKLSNLGAKFNPPEVR